MLELQSSIDRSISARASASIIPIALIHPAIVLPAVWLAVLALYSMHLSRLLIFTTEDILGVTTWVLLPYLGTVAVTESFYALAPRHVAVSLCSPRLSTSKLRLLLARSFYLWCAMTVVEVITSGGLPILWLLTGSSKTYFDFGIPSIHGLLNSLLLSIGLAYVALFLIEGKKRDLRVPGWILLWSMLVATRNMMVVFVMESFFAWILLRGILWRSILKITGSALLGIVLFGYIGDARSGAEAFRVLAQPSDAYPEWLPSGVLWVYIYMTTPLGNLTNTEFTTEATHNILFPNTTATLFPTFIRELIYSGADASAAFGGELITSAFNVSTAFVGPFQDYGRPGIALFAIGIGLVASILWHRNGIRGDLIYSVLAQCLVLSIFFNHFFYLPIAAQAVWLCIFFPSGTHLNAAGRSLS